MPPLYPLGYSLLYIFYWESLCLLLGVENRKAMGDILVLSLALTFGHVSSVAL